ncbi:MAG: hypothetical protein R3338_03115 [Thermoanaerobaculia bacterium]|nr:hypothetical protein [Thermoanaerobaculia bacterium]
MENPAGLQPRELLEKIRRDEVPPEFLGMVAKGFLPIPQEELIAILAVLARHSNEVIASDARNSLREIPRSGLLSFARDEGSPSAGLDAMLLDIDDQEIQGTLIRNRSTSNEAVAELAAKAPGRLQEVIVTNQKRLLESPEVLERLLENPELTGDVRRRALEVREEFFEKKAERDARKAAEEQKAREEAEAAALSEEEAETLGELLEEAEAEGEEEGEEDEREVPEDVPEEEKSIWLRILEMGVSDRVKMAFRGGRTERGILIKDRNKLVCTAVIKSPRLTESEVESFASMRNLEKEVLRLIGSNREWMRKYPIMHTLIRNPKAPIGVVLPLINRLNLRDLKKLSQDRNVPDAVRTQAKKLYVNRSKRS